ncbi:MAG: cytochrome c, partial [Verrucomicrobiota bacterium]
GMACGACHIAFDPLNPPADPAHPTWANLKGLVGNQYIRPSEIMASGMATDSPEWQIFTHARPGVVDTSAVPNDQVHNPGTMNALVNVRRRPTFVGEVVNRWRRAGSCKPGESEDVCWCEADKPGKCWLKSQLSEPVHHILKGGEDSIGIEGALQRVFFNIGVCAETCWANHLTDLRQLDPQQRNFGQTPFDIAQCRRDCPNFRAIEDRLPELVSFVLSKEGRATDLAVARDPDPARPLAVKRKNLVDNLEKEFGRGAVARGKTVFAANCARCHSSQAEPFDKRDFLETDGADPSLRADWLGNDQATPASEVGTCACRALHSNHLQGHVWSEFASQTYQTRAGDANLPDTSGGGRGYYRNVSLVSLWAHAPFMHNNAIGPELCGKPTNKRDDFYRAPFVDGTGHLLANQPACVAYDPSVAGRFAIYKQSMDSLLNPAARLPKMSVLDEPIRLDVGPRTWDGNKEKRIVGMTIEFPPGTPASFFGNFQHKQFVIDLVLAKTDGAALRARLQSRLGRRPEGAKRVDAVAKELEAIADDILKHPSQFVTLARQRMPLLEELYLSCASTIENAGHRFGEDLAPADKKALTAFLATL